MFKYYLVSLCLIFLLLNSCSSSSGIAGRSNSRDKMQIEKIKEGALLVRLYVLNPKIQVLQSLARNPELSEEKRGAAQKQLDELVQNRKNYVASVINVFTEHYDYSELYFIPDSLFKNFTAGQRQNLFYNPKTHKIDPNIQFDHSEYIIFSTGKPDYKYSLLFPDLQIMSRPKRYYGIFAGSFLADIFPFIKNQEEARIKSIQDLNSSFHRVWEELQ